MKEPIDEAAEQKKRDAEADNVVRGFTQYGARVRRTPSGLTIIEQPRDHDLDGPYL